MLVENKKANKRIKRQQPDKVHKGKRKQKRIFAAPGKKKKR